MGDRTRFSRWRRFSRMPYYGSVGTNPVNTWDSRAIGGTNNPFRFAGGGAPRQDKRTVPNYKSWRVRSPKRGERDHGK